MELYIYEDQDGEQKYPPVGQKRNDYSIVEMLNRRQLISIDKNDQKLTLMCYALISKEGSRSIGVFFKFVDTISDNYFTKFNQVASDALNSVGYYLNSDQNNILFKHIEHFNKQNSSPNSFLNYDSDVIVKCLYSCKNLKFYNGTIADISSICRNVIFNLDLVSVSIFDNNCGFLEKNKRNISDLEIYIRDLNTHLTASEDTNQIILQTQDNIKRKEEEDIRYRKKLEKEKTKKLAKDSFLSELKSLESCHSSNEVDQFIFQNCFSGKETEYILSLLKDSYPDIYNMYSEKTLQTSIQNQIVQTYQPHITDPDLTSTKEYSPNIPEKRSPNTQGRRSSRTQNETRQTSQYEVTSTSSRVNDSISVNPPKSKGNSRKGLYNNIDKEKSSYQSFISGLFKSKSTSKNVNKAGGNTKPFNITLSKLSRISIYFLMVVMLLIFIIYILLHFHYISLPPYFYNDGGFGF